MHRMILNGLALPVQAGRRIADIAEAPPLGMARHALDGAVLSGGDVSERSATVAHNDPRRVTPL